MTSSPLEFPSHSLLAVSILLDRLSLCRDHPTSSPSSAQAFRHPLAAFGPFPVPTNKHQLTEITSGALEHLGAKEGGDAETVPHLLIWAPHHLSSHSQWPAASSYCPSRECFCSPALLLCTNELSSGNLIWQVAPCQAESVNPCGSLVLTPALSLSLSFYFV